VHVYVSLHSNNAFLFSAFILLQWVGCAAIILAYDMTNADSFKSCAKWMEMATEAFGGRKIKGMAAFHDGRHRQPWYSGRFIALFMFHWLFFAGVLLGCKGDMQDAIAVTTRAAQDFAAEHGLQHFECSAVRFLLSNDYSFCVMNVRMISA
jgi:hypothetical protein